MSISEFATEKAFNAYMDYMAVKRHFDTPTYDYFKSNGRVKCSFSKFASRHDVIYFNKAGKLEDLTEMLVANLSLNTKLWIVDILDEKGMNTFRDFRSKNRMMSRLVQQSSSFLKKDFAENFIIPPEGYPHIIDMMLEGEISFELFTVLVNKTKILPYWEQKLGGKFFIGDIVHRSKKLYKFLNIDHPKVNDAIKQNFLL